MKIFGKVRVPMFSQEGLTCKCGAKLPPEQGLYIVIDEDDKRHELCYGCVKKLEKGGE